MGWWSATILGGDTPLDLVFDIEDIVGIDRDGDRQEITKKHLDDHQAELTAWAVDPKHGGDTDEIARQVLAFHILKTGAHLSPVVRELAMEACLADEWFREGEADRVKHIMALHDAVKNYNVTGGPVPLTEEGLFDVLFEKTGS
jgi:hypothetical protein